MYLYFVRLDPISKSSNCRRYFCFGLRTSGPNRRVTSPSNGRYTMYELSKERAGNHRSCRPIKGFLDGPIGAVNITSTAQTCISDGAMSELKFARFVRDPDLTKGVMIHSLKKIKIGRPILSAGFWTIDGSHRMLAVQNPDRTMAVIPGFGRFRELYEVRTNFQKISPEVICPFYM